MVESLTNPRARRLAAWNRSVYSLHEADGLAGLSPDDVFEMAAYHRGDLFHGLDPLRAHDASVPMPKGPAHDMDR